MSDSESAAVDGIQRIIVGTGGCGRYQLLLSIIIHSMKCIVCFSAIYMMFAAKEPDWWCVDGVPPENITDDNIPSHPETFKSCSAFNSSSSCTTFVFHDSVSTVVSEWALVCSKDWVPSTIASVQMAGTFVGNLASGQIADLFGRKPPLFMAVSFLVLLNIIAVFSVNWVMFAVLRFFVGLAVGIYFTVQYSLQSEFTLARWRTWVVAVPSWDIETALFALSAWLTEDWKYLSIVAAAAGFPLLFSYWFVPESYRWYLSHNRKEDAKQIIYNVARINRKPDFVLDDNDLVIDEEDKEKDRKYTFLDLVRHKNMLKLSFLLLIIWLTLGLGTYGIQFGVSALSGNLYLNIFFTALLGGPLQFINIFLMNRFGRKKTATFFYIIFAVTALVVGIAKRLEGSQVRDNVSSYSALVSLTAVNAAWSPVQTLTTELYPTVVRNLGYGLQNTLARVGAIIGPQLVFLDSKVAGLMYFVCAGVGLVSIATLVPLPETRSADLGDKISSSKVNKQKSEGVTNPVINEMSEDTHL